MCVHSRNVKPLTVNRYSLDLIRSQIELHQIIRSNNFPFFFSSLFTTFNSIEFQFEFDEKSTKIRFSLIKITQSFDVCHTFFISLLKLLFFQRGCPTCKATPTIDNSNNNNNFFLRQFIGGNRIILLFLVKSNFSSFSILYLSLSSLLIFLHFGVHIQHYTNNR